MATLKYKNGNTWTELNLGSGGLNEYPVGSFYCTPRVLVNYNLKWNYSNSSELLSPASLFGGSWQKVELYAASNKIGADILDSSLLTTVSNNNSTSFNAYMRYPASSTTTEMTFRAVNYLRLSQSVYSDPYAIISKIPANITQGTPSAVVFVYSMYQRIA